MPRCATARSTSGGSFSASRTPERPLKTRLAVGVFIAWALIALVVAAQGAIGGALQGEPVGFGAALGGTFMQILPWVPITLAVIAVAARFPLDRRNWMRHLPVHLVAAPIAAFLVNFLLVLTFRVRGGQPLDVLSISNAAWFWAAMRFHLALLVYVAIVAVTQAVQYYRDTRARELSVARLEAQLARARLQALNAQIRPHFLFNTLHTIGQLWRSGRSDDADTVLDHLGSLFHRVQRSTMLPEVPLADELEMVEAYLAIEQVRFRDRMRVRVEASPAARACAVPPLILQPIVENAVRHGISAASAAGALEVTAHVEGRRLLLRVRDDGPGMNGKSVAPGSGTGLRNTRERLEQLYGAAAELVVGSSAGGGAEITIRMPARAAADVEQEPLHA